MTEIKPVQELYEMCKRGEAISDEILAKTPVKTFQHMDTSNEEWHGRFRGFPNTMIQYNRRGQKLIFQFTHFDEKYEMETLFYHHKDFEI